jgi:CubicO group peptidase (beta-lactamase class C family)
MKMIFSRHVFTGITLFLLMLWLALIPMSAFAATSHTSVPDFATIDAYVLAQMRQLHIPGVALGIMHGSQVVHLRGFGIADPSGRSVTPQTTFAISSMTKSFTAVAIMQLVEPGKVTLDAPVQRYLPWFRVATPNASGKITVRELLNQTSGISHSAGNGVLADTGDKNMQQAVQTLSTVELFAPLGTAFQYSNINYVTLGLIVQVASGQTYEMYVQQHIFAPLQMNNAFTLTSQDTTMHNGMATGYRWWFGLPIPFNHHGNPPAEVALPIGLFVELPKALGVSWAVALLFWPDFSFWLLGMFVFLLITGMARIVRIIGLVTRSRRKNRGTSPVPI